MSVWLKYFPREIAVIDRLFLSYTLSIIIVVASCSPPRCPAEYSPLHPPPQVLLLLLSTLYCWTRASVNKKKSWIESSNKYILVPRTTENTLIFRETDPTLSTLSLVS